MRYHAFLSYSSADRPFAKRLHEDLTAQGLEIWWDVEELRSRGRDAAMEIRDVIRASGDYFLLLVGGATLTRPYVRAELTPWVHRPLTPVGNYSNELFKWLTGGVGDGGWKGIT
jgi:hypothetical protein